MQVAQATLLLVLLAVSLATSARAIDTDGDGFDDGPADNCDYWANPGQEDFDGDDFGDPCDADADDDGVVDVAPEIRVARQDGNADSVRLLWSRGSGAFGDPAPDVTGYQLERSQDAGPFVVVASGDFRWMTAVDTLPGPGTYDYRVRLLTGGGLYAISEIETVVASFPLFPLEEALDGVARIAWSDMWTPPAGTTLAGYELQRFDGAWFAAHAGLLTDTVFLDDDGFPSAAQDSGVGTNRYRVRAVFDDGIGGQQFAAWSNEEILEIEAECPEIGVPLPTNVVVADDLDSDLDYDGDDLKLALDACAMAGGCVLRALPETYENVSIMVTTSAASCDGTITDLTNPQYCLLLDFPNGLVIEGHGEQTVFRSPLWTPPTRPPAVLEFHRKTFPLRLRNLVLDGRKHEQVAPDPGPTINCASWHHNGLRVWNQFQLRDIPDDGIGDDDNLCELEACLEDPAGGHDGDGLCEPDEACIEDLAGAGDNDGVCENEFWKTYDACESQTEQNDGCLHNVVARGFTSNGATFNNTRRWTIEHSRFEDVGCWNGGDGFDCPYMDTAPNFGPPGVKCTSFGMTAGDYTREFVIRDNVFERANKYGIQLKNGPASSCNGLLYDHQITGNTFRDLGHQGIFAVGVRGARIQDNHVEGTVVWPLIEPSGNNNTYGINLGGFCSDDNEVSGNTLTQLAGLAIGVNTDTETYDCSTGSCSLAPEIGNTIEGNTISGTCLQKNTASGTPSVYELGSIHFFSLAHGLVRLVDNVMTQSGCRFTLSVFGGRPMRAEVSGGSYESGPNAATAAQESFYAGALHVHGTGRRLDVLPGVDFTNAGDPAVPKASAQLSGRVVVDDIASDPFAPGPFGTALEGSGGLVVFLPAPATGLGLFWGALAVAAIHRNRRAHR
ncbi:MAG: right-handed parallel beta-helix repeat-containing protein [Myxococcota bacterium]